MSRPISEIEADLRKCQSAIMRSSPRYPENFEPLVQQELKLLQERDQAKNEAEHERMF